MTKRFSVPDRKRTVPLISKLCVTLLVAIGLTLSFASFEARADSQQGSNQGNNQGNNKPSPTPRQTATPTATPKQSPSPTPRHSPTPTVTPKPTPKPSPTPRPSPPSPTPKPTPKPSPSPTPRGKCAVCDHVGGKNIDRQIDCKDVDEYLREHPTSTRGPCNVTPVTNP